MVRAKDKYGAEVNKKSKMNIKPLMLTSGSASRRASHCR
jgi:hypothetical protein